MRRSRPGVYSIVVLLGAACYSPVPPTGAPCPDGVCPSPLVCAPATRTCEDPSNAALDASMLPSAFLYRVAITFVAEADATNAIILIVLDASFPYAHVAADGSDLRIVRAADGDMPFWIESWEPGGISRVWARVPTVVAGTNQIYAYYGHREGGVASTADFAQTFPGVLMTAGDDELGGTLVHDAVIVEAEHTIRVTPGTPLDITAAYVRISGTLDADAAGYEGMMGPGAGGMSTSGGAGGGGHGGSGGEGGKDDTDTPGAGGLAYGSASSEDVDMGAGGGTTNSVPVGARGGGAVRILARRIVVDGAITARGEAGTVGVRSTGGGGGGGVLLRAASIEMSGSISVAGGLGASASSAANDGGGGGGGGRIKLFGEDITNTGSLEIVGGPGGSGGSAAPGQPGEPGSQFSGTSPSIAPLPTIGPEEAL